MINIYTCMFGNKHWIFYFFFRLLFLILLLTSLNHNAFIIIVMLIILLWLDLRFKTIPLLALQKYDKYIRNITFQIMYWMVTRTPDFKKWKFFFLKLLSNFTTFIYYVFVSIKVGSYVFIIIMIYIYLYFFYSIKLLVCWCLSQVRNNLLLMR